MKKEKKNIHELNLIGLRCPIPVLKISKKYKEIRSGEIISAKLDDPRAENDINNLCKTIKIKLLDKRENNNFFLYILEKN